MKRVFFLFLLFLFFNFIFSQSVEDIKISSIPLNASCKEFWKKDLPPKLVSTKFFDGQKIYSPYLFYTLESLNLNNWSLEEADETYIDLKIPDYFSKEKQLLKDSYSLAKKAKNHYNLAYEKYTQIAFTIKVFKLLLPIVFPPIFFLNIEKELETLREILEQPYSLEEEILISYQFLLADFSLHWENSISSATSSLKSCTLALNSIFNSAQKRAIMLYENDIENPNYFGKPKEIYNEWKEFVQLSKNYSLNKIRSPTEPAIYGWVYFLSNSIRQTCNLEQIFPYFYPMDFLFNNACIIKEGTLLDFAIKMDKKLSYALELLEAEKESAFNSTSSLKSRVEEKIKNIKSEEPSKFRGDEIFSIQTSSFKITNVSGDIEELYNSMLSYSLEGQSYFNSASKSKKLVEKILLYKKATTSYELAMQSAAQLEELLIQKSNLSCSFAESELRFLSNKIKNVQAQKNLSLLANLLETYNSASDLVEKAKNSKKLSDKFLICKKAYLILTTNSKSDYSISISEALLKKFLDYIVAGEKMGADVSSYRKNYEDFKKLLTLNYSLQLEDIESNIISIRNYLNNFMEEENTIYESISILLENSKGTQKDFSYSFNKKLSQYRENNQWNLYAFKNRNALLNFLRSSLKQLQSNLELYVKDAICKKAKIYKLNHDTFTVDEISKISGWWESSNPLTISFPNGLQLSCKIDLDISNNAIKAKSSNIESVVISNKTLKIVLSSLAPSENIYLNFSEEKKAFSSSLKNCLLYINSNNKISLESNYTINSLYSSEFVQFFVPWDTSLDNIEAKAYDGVSFYTGVLSIANNLPSIKFIFPINSSKISLSAFIKSTLPRNLEHSEENISNITDGRYSYSYKLKLIAPQCKNIFIQRMERFSNISNLKITSADASIKNLKYYLVGSNSYWEAMLNSKSDNVILNVYFEFSDLEKWFNSSYSELLEKAKKHNDDYSLKLLESALSSFKSKDYKGASKKLNEVKKRLDSIELKKEKIDLAQERIILLNKKLDVFNSFTSSDNKKVSTIKSFSNSLKNAIESANRTLISDPDNSIINLEKANAKINSDILKEINSISPKIQKRLDSLISLSLDSDLDYSNLSVIADELAKVRELMLSDEFPSALISLYNASDKLDLEEKTLTDLITKKLEELNTKRINIERLSQELISKWDKYFTQAKTLEAAKTLFKPPIASKDVQNYKKPLLSLFKNWEEKKSNSSEILAKSLQKNQLVLAKAQETLNSTHLSYSQAQEKLFNKANSLLANAKLLLNASSNEQKKDLEEKISKSEELMNNEEYAQAIVLLEKLIRSSSSPSQNLKNQQEAAAPLFEIFVSIVFILAVVYILFKSYSKPKLLEQKKEIKTLKKSQENKEEDAKSKTS